MRIEGCLTAVLFPFSEGELLMNDILKLAIKVVWRWIILVLLALLAFMIVRFSIKVSQATDENGNVQPVNRPAKTYIAVTEKIGDKIQQILTGDAAEISYFETIEENIADMDPADVFPSLKDPAPEKKPTKLIEETTNLNGFALSDELPLPSPAGIRENEYNTGDTLEVYFLDVGQADSTLVCLGSHAALIDGGNIEDGPLLADYLTGMGIYALDYVIATHAHEDHIGGLSAIYDALDVTNAVSPKDGLEESAAVYGYYERSVQSEGCLVLSPTQGDHYDLGGATFTIISCDPVDDATDPNQSSIVLRLDYGDSSFLFCADAVIANEQAVLSTGLDVDVDILRVGHHGSYTSSSLPWLQAVSPTEAIISCGEGNEFGHPHSVTLRHLDALDIPITRTDQVGTILISTNGDGRYSETFPPTDLDGIPSV